MKEEIWKEVSKEKMPLWQYELLHPDAKLTEKELSLIKDWAGE